MKTSILIPIRNELYIEKQIRSIENQSVVPDEVIYLFDRFTPSEHILSIIKNTHLNIKYIKNETTMTGFLAGMCRDMLLLESSNDILILIDEDCIPSPKFNEIHLNSHINNYNKIALFIGQRRYDKYYYDSRNDVIEWGRPLKRVPHNITLTYTCNLSISRHTYIELLKLSGMMGSPYTIFNKKFNGEWGYEDGYLGMCVKLILGGDINTLSDECYVVESDIEPGSYIEEHNIISDIYRGNHIQLSRSHRKNKNHVLFNKYINFIHKLKNFYDNDKCMMHFNTHIHNNGHNISELPCVYGWINSDKKKHSTNDIHKTCNGTCIVLKSGIKYEYHPSHKTLSFNVLQSCNLICNSCRTEHVSIDKHDDSILINYIEYIYKYNPSHITLDGSGEIFNYLLYHELFDQLGKIPFIKSIHIITNLTLLNEYTWNRINIEAQHKIKSISISMDSTEPLKLGNIRKNLRFDSFMKNLDFVKTLNLNMTLHVVLTKTNIMENIQFVKFAKKHGFGKINLYQPYIFDTLYPQKSFTDVINDTDHTAEIKEMIKLCIMHGIELNQNVYHVNDIFK